MRLGQVMLFVVDLDRMRAFYGDAMGLAVVEASEGWVRFDAGGAWLALHAIPAHIARDIEIADPPRPRSDTAIKVTFHAEDVDAARARLAAHGAAMSEVVRRGDAVRCDGADPEGNVFQIANR